jgi:hypothetical protein
MKQSPRGDKLVDICSRVPLVRRTLPDVGRTEPQFDSSSAFDTFNSLIYYQHQSMNMYSKAATAAIILAFIAATEAKIDVAVIKKTFTRDSARIRSRKAKTLPTNKVPKKDQRLRQAIQTSPTYVSVDIYNSSDCSNSQPLESVTYGTNVCLAISDTNGITAGSTQYTWDSTNNILSEVYYSDDACTTNVAMGTMYDFTSDETSGTCVFGIEFSSSSTYAIADDGYVYQ